MSVILLVDAGNTRLKWALWGAEGWGTKGAVPLDALPGLTAAWAGLRPAWIGVSCVAGPALVEALGALLARFPAPVFWLRAMAEGFGIRNGYARPEQLGCDRFAVLVACQRLGLSPCVVASAGTAVTVDALTGQGDYLGGIILPGLGLMRDALRGGTAGVGDVAGGLALFPTSTGDGVETGIRLAAQGAVREMHRRLAACPSAEAAPGIVLTGGDAALLAEGMEGSLQPRADLVLEGLRCIAQDLGVLEHRGA